MAAVAFGVIADARAIQRRRRRWTGLGLVLLAFVGGGIAAASLHHRATPHAVSVRIVVGRRVGFPPVAVPYLVGSRPVATPLDRALRTVRNERGFASLRVTPPPSSLQPARHGAGKPAILVVVYPATSLIDAHFRTTLPPAKLVQDLRRKLAGLARVSLVAS